MIDVMMNAYTDTLFTIFTILVVLFPLITYIGLNTTYRRMEPDNLENLRFKYGLSRRGKIILTHQYLFCSVMPRSFQEKRLLGLDVKSKATLLDKILGCLLILIMALTCFSIISFLILMTSQRLQIYDFGIGHFEVDDRTTGGILSYLFEALYDFLRPRIRTQEFWGKVTLLVSFLIYRKIKK